MKGKANKKPGEKTLLTVHEQRATRIYKLSDGQINRRANKQETNKQASGKTKK